MTNRVLAVLTVLGISLMISASVFAHHGTSVYDETQTITEKGIVTEFEWTNPHALIHFDVTRPDGKVENWIAQETSLNMLNRQGWNKYTLKPGDKITLVGNRFKNGANYMLGRRIILADGREFSYDGR